MYLRIRQYITNDDEKTVGSRIYNGERLKRRKNLQFRCNETTDEVLFFAYIYICYGDTVTELRYAVTNIIQHDIKFKRSEINIVSAF